MDYTTCYCHSSKCPLYGQVAPSARLKMHDWQRQGPRFRCERCGGGVSATTGTAYVGISNSNFDSARGLRLSIDTDKVKVTLLREPRRQL
jgi:hypothetical protein